MDRLPYHFLLTVQRLCAKVALPTRYGRMRRTHAESCGLLGVGACQRYALSFL